MADLASQQQLQVGELETQMYEQSVSDYISVLMGAAGMDAKRIESQQSFWDQLLQTSKQAVQSGAKTASGE